MGTGIRPSAKSPLSAIRVFFVLCVLLSGASPLLPEEALAQPSSEPSVQGSASAAESIEVSEAVVCTGIEDRQPQGAAERFPPDVGELYCWLRVLEGAGEILSHVWIHEGETRARVELEVGADHWRAWSSKRILPDWTGTWEVKVLTADGRVLESLSFVIGEDVGQ